jgi:hypothetical protein
MKITVKKADHTYNKFHLQMLPNADNSWWSSMTATINTLQNEMQWNSCHFHLLQPPVDFGETMIVVPCTEKHNHSFSLEVLPILPYIC